MMRVWGRNIFLLLCLGCLGCTATKPASVSSGNPDLQDVLESLTAALIIPTYENLALQAQGLMDAAITFQGDPSESNNQALRLAWVEARAPWEEGEAFAFGPMIFEGFDGAMDTWPIDVEGIAAILAAADPIDLNFIEGQGPSLKGFHVLEYLIFGEEAGKTPADFTPRELDYLVFACEHLRDLAASLRDAWVIGINGAPPFAETFMNPGNTIFPNHAAAINEIFLAVLGALEEVGEEKIGGPLSHQDPSLLESQYSQNSLHDFISNLTGVEKVYQVSLSRLVLAYDPLLDPLLENHLQAALDQVNVILPPFEITVFDPSEAEVIEAAIHAIGAAHDQISRVIGPYIPPQI